MSDDKPGNVIDGTAPNHVRERNPYRTMLWIAITSACISLVQLLGLWVALSIVVLVVSVALLAVTVYHDNTVVRLRSQLTLLAWTVKRIKGGE